MEEGRFIHETKDIGKFGIEVFIDNGARSGRDTDQRCHPIVLDVYFCRFCQCHWRSFAIQMCVGEDGMSPFIPELLLSRRKKIATAICSIRGRVILDRVLGVLVVPKKDMGLFDDNDGVGYE